MSDKAKRNINLTAILSMVGMFFGGVSFLVGHEFAQASDIKANTNLIEGTNKTAREAKETIHEMQRGILIKLESLSNKIGDVAVDVAKIKGQMEKKP